MQHYLKLAVIIASIWVAFICDSNAANTTVSIPIETKIVGGEEVATENDWPWMSALVFTSNKISTTLTVDNTNYDSQAFTFGFTGSATGITVDCGIGNTPCNNATNKICLIERGTYTFAEKVKNCQAGGGIAAIIYNNIEGSINGTLGENFTGTIPAISITQADGITLKAKIGASASLTVIEEAASAQSSICGASFIGDKWLLTASHCVDGTSPQQLKVNVGEYDLSNGAENAKAVKRIYMHPDYELDVELNNDIALIELVDNITNPAITAISLIDLSATEQFATQNSTVTVIGWGGREGYEADGGPTSNFPDVLHQVDLELRTNEECKSILAQSYTDAFEGTFTTNDIGITDAMICAYTPSGGKGSCQGDSGGPLMINTNEGWQQIGIVSWGIGCAAKDYAFPGVYTRTALFNEWINEITQGIAIDQFFDFTIQAQNNAKSAELSVINNSGLSANLTYSIDGHANFTIANGNCNTIAAGASCSLQVNYDAIEVGTHNAKIIINSDNSDIATSSAKISAQTIALSSKIQTQLSNNDNALTWYSGGSDNNSAWQLDNAEAAIVSGNIKGNQQSIVMVTLSGEGELSFDWSVSSEENTDEPAEPFDALYLYVDGELIKFISGEVGYQSESVVFAAGEHNITWVYQKDQFKSAGDDNAHIRNVVYTPTNATTPITPSPTPITPNESSSGGSVAWLSLILVAVIRLIRR